jgi:methyltransferase
LARAFAIFNIDEIVIFNERIRKKSESSTQQIETRTKNKREEGISSDPNVFLARILQYLETPQLVTLFICK